MRAIQMDSPHFYLLGLRHFFCSTNGEAFRETNKTNKNIELKKKIL